METTDLYNSIVLSCTDLLVFFMHHTILSDFSHTVKSSLYQAFHKAIYYSCVYLQFNPSSFLILHTYSNFLLTRTYKSNFCFITLISNSPPTFDMCGRRHKKSTHLWENGFWLRLIIIKARRQNQLTSLLWSQFLCRKLMELFSLII